MPNELVTPAAFIQELLDTAERSTRAVCADFGVTDEREIQRRIADVQIAAARALQGTMRPPSGGNGANA